MAFTINQTPRLQIGDAPLGSPTDQVALIWQTKGSNSGDSFVVQYRLVNSTEPWQTADAPSVLNTGTDSRMNHYTTITGLDYSSKYEYRVQHLRNGSLVNTYQDNFETRLGAGDDTPFSFAAYGDSAYINGNSGFREVQGQIKQSLIKSQELIKRDVHFTTFNSDDALDSARNLTQELQFLEEDLKASNADLENCFCSPSYRWCSR